MAVAQRRVICAIRVIVLTSYAERSSDEFEVTIFRAATGRAHVRAIFRSTVSAEGSYLVIYGSRRG